MNSLLNEIKNWLISMGSSPSIFRFISIVIPWLYIISLALLIISLSWGLLLAPSDYKQGDVYRIIYIHVPSAILGQSSFILMAIFGFICLVWRAKIAGMLLRSIAPVGASFTFLALVSGSIWGKPTWGTWWVWDARLTSTLILFFLYASIISLFSVIDRRQKADRAASILSVVGIVIIPIIKKSVDWWQTLHQSSTFSLSSSPSMTPDMYTPLLACVIAFYLVFILIVLNRLKVEIILRERSTNWVKQHFFNSS
ncbi:MAG: heme ABC transporter permease [Gammaproteobacteria bacterium]|nr:heme ABC transporter permease [Gammaproteobacteria bacterium]